jgi:mannose-1-phosphate guanylyltransferase
LLTQIGEAWNGPARQRVLDELFPGMPKGSIDYRVLQKTNNACSILLPCSWEDMGTHAALAKRIGEKRGSNLVRGMAVVPGTENVVLASTGQCIVVASDNLTVVVTDNAVLVGNRDTDLKALVELVAQHAPEIV